MRCRSFPNRIRSIHLLTSVCPSLQCRVLPETFNLSSYNLFDEQPAEKNSAEKIIKAVGDVVEPFAKGLKS
jgi:hypothetical protein